MEYHTTQPASIVSLCTLLFSFLVVLAILITKKRRGSLSFPPGPPGYPIVGHMHWMDQVNHRSLAELGKLYGGIVHLRLGVLHLVSVTSPDMAREVLQEHDIIFSDRPTTVAIRYLTYGQSDMAFADYGTFWRQMRKLCVTKLFSRKQVGTWTTVCDEVCSLIHAVRSRVGRTVNMGKMLANMSRSIIFRTAFGSAQVDGQEEFISALLEFNMLMGALNIVDFLPIWLRWVHPKGFNKRLEQTRAALDQFIDPIIDKHMTVYMADKLGESESDLVYELMNFLDDGQQYCGQLPKGSVKLTKDNIKAIMLDLMFGGTETIASTIEWAMSELISHPEELAKVQAELADVMGPKQVIEESDLDKLSYLKCTVKETLRLHPPIPILLHKPAVNSTIGGYFVPAGARISINVWAIGRNPSTWENPDTFMPERFTKGGVANFKDDHFEFIPFGSGRRSCPGMQLGLYALELAVAQLVHCFNWSLPNGLNPSDLNMTEMFGLGAPRAHRLFAIPTPRLECSLCEIFF